VVRAGGGGAVLELALEDLQQGETASVCFIFFRHQNSLFRHNQFSTLFFSKKVAESGKIVLVSCIIDFEDIQV
jgi:hypothetical protein